MFVYNRHASQRVNVNLIIFFRIFYNFVHISLEFSIYLYNFRNVLFKNADFQCILCDF